MLNFTPDPVVNSHHKKVLFCTVVTKERRQSNPSAVLYSNRQWNKV